MRRPLVPGDRVYLAGKFERQAELRALAKEFIRAGYVVTSRWLEAEGLALGTWEEAERAARLDVADVSACDTFVLVTDDVPGRGGKDFETGFAWALGKAILVVGPRCHVFHHLPRVWHCQDVPTLRYTYLGGEKIDALP